MLRATKLKNMLINEAENYNVKIIVMLKNIVINGRNVGCSGFVLCPREDNCSCVYVNTEPSACESLKGKVMYRYALNEKDFSSNGLKNGQNRFCAENETASAIISYLTSGFPIKNKKE